LGTLQRFQSGSVACLLEFRRQIGALTNGTNLSIDGLFCAVTRPESIWVGPPLG
jgi:hypothetical protein